MLTAHIVPQYADLVRQSSWAPCPSVCRLGETVELSLLYITQFTLARLKRIWVGNAALNTETVMTLLWENARAPYIRSTPPSSVRGRLDGCRGLKSLLPMALCCHAVSEPGQFGWRGRSSHCGRTRLSALWLAPEYANEWVPKVQCGIYCLV